LAASLLHQTLLPVRPALVLSDGQGRQTRNVEITRWMNGPVQIISLFRRSGAGEQVIVHLPQTRHVTDLKSHRDLGQKQTFEVTITPSRAQFFALSPEPLRPLTLQTAPAVEPGSVQRVRISSASPAGQRAAKVTVKLPNGQTADWVDRVAIVGQRGATIEVPVALNDPRGAWTVTATELYTGQTTTTQFRVK
jgi:hypothetical protein